MIYGHGGDIYTYGDMLDFSVNINPLGPPGKAVDAAKRSMDQITAYPDSRCRELRKKLADKEGMPEDFYIFGNGAAEILYTLVLALKPKRALLPVPAFSEYEQALRSGGCHIEYYTTKQENGFCIDEDFLSEITEDIDILFLCSPSNPSGHAIRRELMEQVAVRCEKQNVRMVLDECFVGFLEDPGRYSMLCFAAQYKQLFLVRAFTKIYAMPGLRLGYGITSDCGLLEAMEAARQPWSVSIPAQAAGTAALDDEETVSRAGRFISEQREKMEENLRRHGIRFVPSDANFILFYTEINLFEELKKYRILIRDCSNYRGLGRGWYRIAVRTAEENAVLMKALDEIMAGSTGKYAKEDDR